MAIDTRLKWLLQERGQGLGSFHDAIEAIAGPHQNESKWTGPIEIDILVRAKPGTDPQSFEADITNRGLKVHSINKSTALPTATGRIALDDLGQLDGSPYVGRLEAPRELQPELLVSIPSCGASGAHKYVPPARAGNAIAGIVDGGIDYAHAVFRTTGGATRILALWDQAAPSVVGGTVPYGRVYTQAEIDQAFAPNPALAHADFQGHGTHVASCMAGSGTRDGVAPDADLLIVAFTGGGQTLGRSKNAVDAFDWIVAQARARNRTVAINMSQGMNGGGHVGSSLVEIAMDAHCRSPGVAIVKSAGNEGGWRSHATATIATVGTVVTFEVACHPNKYTPGSLELWFDERDDLEISVEPPTNAPSLWYGVVNMPQTLVFGGNRVRIDIDYDPESTGDNLITVIFTPGNSGAGIMPGTWRVRLRARSLAGGGLVHGWIERAGRSPASDQLRFSPASADLTGTISIPGTARRVITVGSYVTTPVPPGSALVNAISSFSSQGPTRYGLQKPDLAAPGEYIEAARSSASGGNGPWTQMAGTSMAAPHAAGAAAILMSENAALTGEQVRQILARTSRAGATSPDNVFGAGLLDVAAAVTLLRTAPPTFPQVVSAQLVGTQFTITTVAMTTASLIYDANAGRVLAGRRTGSLASLAQALTHRFDLTQMGTGTWHFEVHLFDADWRTIADDRGTPWTVTIP